MANWHIEELRKALERRGWQVLAELPGDAYAISATWQLRQHGTQKVVLLDFKGLDDMNTLSLNKSYGCQMRGTNQTLYFARRGVTGSDARTRWQQELAAFVEVISDEQNFRQTA